MGRCAGGREAAAHSEPTREPDESAQAGEFAGCRSLSAPSGDGVSPRRTGHHAYVEQEDLQQAAGPAGTRRSARHATAVVLAFARS